MKFKLILLLLIFAEVVFSQQSDLQNRFMLAQSYEQIGEYIKAKSLYEDLYKAQPNNFTFFQALNKCYLQLKEYNNSSFLIQQKLSVERDNVSLVGLLGVTFYLNGEEKKTFQLWDDFLENKKSDVISFRVLANSAIELRAFDKAIDLLQRAKSISNKEFYFGYDLANLYALKMDYKKSASEFIFILKTDEQQLPSVESRIFTYVNRSEALVAFIKVFEDEQPERFLVIGNILAKLYSANRQYENAFSLYQILDNKGQYKGTELFNFALKLSAEKEYAFASEVFSYLLKKYPDSPVQLQIKLSLAKNSEAKLEIETADSSQLWKSFPRKKYSPEKLYEESLSIYKEIAEKNPFSELGVEAMFRTGYLYGEKIGDTKASEEYLNKIISNFLFSNFYAQACLEMAAINLQNGNIAGASSFYDKILANPRASEAQKNKAKFWKARMMFFQGNFTESNKLLRQIVSVSTDNMSNDAMELSFLLTSAFNDSLTLVKFAEGDFALLVNDFNKAEKTFSSLVKTEQTPFLIKQLAELRLIESEISSDRYQEALAQIDSLLKREEKNIFADKANLLAAKIYQYGFKNPVKAIEEYQNLLLRFPDSLYLDEAREAINKLRNKIS
ncbi:MAG: tetratricopeptide repeat protein [Ignavibacteriaceae bacterium]|nr:tetratricopeptide repeat protein [Ignavibacteriaceae bacterium]